MNSPETFIFSPVLPWWLLLPAGICFALGLWRTYGSCPLSPRRKAFLFALRIIAFLIFTWLLLLPSRREKSVEYEKPVLAVVMDSSASMTDNPGGALRTRAQRASDFLLDPAVRSRFRDYRVRYFAVGSRLRETDGGITDQSFTDYRSFLKQGLNGAADRLRGENLSAVILLSDGLDQGDDRLGPQFASLPVFVPLLEDLQPAGSLRQDFALENLSAPRRINRKWEAEISVGIRRRNGSAPAEFTAVFMDGQQELRRETVRFQQNQLFRKLEFTYRGEELGTRLLSIAIDPQEDAVGDNNRQELVLEVVDGEKNILYLEGIPRWEFKFLKRSLLNEQNQKLHACLQTGTGAFISFAEGDEPARLTDFTEKSLSQYRLVILGELTQAAFPEKKAELLADFVKKGGGLLLLGGARIYSPEGAAAIPAIRELLPGVPEPGAGMREGRFSVNFTGGALTRKGLEKLAETGSFPPVLSLLGPVKKGPFADVWLEAADGSPVILTGRAGEGRTAMIFSDSLWRWQLGASAAGQDKSLYAGLMTQLVEWLVPGTEKAGGDHDLGIELSGNEAVLYENLEIQALPGANVNPGGLSCRIQPPRGNELVFPVRKTKNNATGKTEYRCSYIPPQTGLYRITVFNQEGIHSRTALLPVKKPEFEFTGAFVNRKDLEELAGETGGLCCPWKDRKKILSALPGEKRRYESVKEYPVWNHWGYLAALILLFSLEWFFHRKWDLL